MWVAPTRLPPGTQVAAARRRLAELVDVPGPEWTVCEGLMAARGWLDERLEAFGSEVKETAEQHLRSAVALALEGPAPRRPPLVVFVFEGGAEVAIRPRIEQLLARTGLSDMVLMLHDGDRALALKRVRPGRLGLPVLMLWKGDEERLRLRRATGAQIVKAVRDWLNPGAAAA